MLAASTNGPHKLPTSGAVLIVVEWKKLPVLIEPDRPYVVLHGFEPFLGIGRQRIAVRLSSAISHNSVRIQCDDLQENVTAGSASDFVIYELLSRPHRTRGKGSQLGSQIGGLGCVFIFPLGVVHESGLRADELGQQLGYLPIAALGCVLVAHRCARC